MTTTSANLLELLSTKLDYFLEYERATDEMLLTDDEDILKSLMDTREQISIQIDDINRDIAELSSKDNFEYSYVLSYTECGKGSRTEGDEKLLETSEHIFSIIRDLRLKNTDITSKLEAIRLKSLSKIKENFYTPTISSYLQNIQIAPDGNNFGRG